jgi:hypothetical protein
MDEITKTFASNVSFLFKITVLIGGPTATLRGLSTGDTTSRSHLKSVSLMTRYSD